MIIKENESLRDKIRREIKEDMGWLRVQIFNKDWRQRK